MIGPLMSCHATTALYDRYRPTGMVNRWHDLLD